MIELVQRFILPAAFTLLPPEMASPEATALLLAIGIQESRFAFRRQVNGSARSFWQFELGGLRGVLRHKESGPILADACLSLRYDQTDEAGLFLAIEHNDVLAACCARCLLWTLPDALPGPSDIAHGWQQYRAAWRPGKPRQETWTANYAIAWGAVLNGRKDVGHVRA